MTSPLRRLDLSPGNVTSALSEASPGVTATADGSVTTSAAFSRDGVLEQPRRRAKTTSQSRKRLGAEEPEAKNYGATRTGVDDVSPGNTRTVTHVLTRTPYRVA